MDRLRQDCVERLAAEPHCQRDLLVGLVPPAAAVHHPQEVWLHPTHSAEAEWPAEVAVPGGEVADLRTKRLVDDGRILVELCEDVPSGAGPSLPLLQVWFCQKVHVSSKS